MGRKYITIIVILGIALYAGIQYCYWCLPIEFINEELNIRFSVILSIFFIVLYIYSFFVLSGMQYRVLKILLRLFYIINIIGLMFYIPLSIYRIDPPLQFVDSKVLFEKKGNINDKVVEQYYENWKTGERTYRINQLCDYGIIRHFKKYNADTTYYAENPKVWTKVYCLKQD